MDDDRGQRRPRQGERLALDLGAATVFFYTFQQREYLYDLFEKLTGARFTTSTVRIGGMARDIPPGWLERLSAWNKQVRAHYDEMEGLLTRNRIWLDRTQNVGVISLDQAKALGLTGPPLRASGIEWDLRKAQPYLGYEEYDFEIPARRYLGKLLKKRGLDKTADPA